MIRFIHADIFTVDSQVIVNPVNCKGVMGLGLAAQFKKRFPEMYLQYVQDCNDRTLQIGKPTLYIKSQPYILNFATKDHYKDSSRIEFITTSLQYFVEHYTQFPVVNSFVSINSIAFPKLGTGYGRLSWEAVKSILIEYLKVLPIEVIICE